jgi:hypothetical protein
MTMKKTSTASAIVSGLRAVTKDWARQRKAEERDASRRAYRYERLVRRHERSIKELAYRVMEEAYLRRAPTAHCRRRRGRSCTRLGR